ncbi:MAG: hypothetical protein SFT93_05040 [Rickettsiaceae bacterium]|nr:hypothetical protein [Rickettsiaceae bacterium]
MIIFYFGCIIFSLLSFLIGWPSGSDFLIYYIPGIFSMINASISSYNLIIRKRELGAFIIYFGNFIFYYLQIVNPSNYEYSIYLMRNLTEQSIFIGSIVIIVQPLLMHASMILWTKALYNKIEKLYSAPTPRNTSLFHKYFFLFFLFLFLINFSLQAITGKVVVSALQTIINLRTQVTYEGLPGIFFSLTFFMATSVSLFFANLYLFKTKYKTVAILTLPFSTIWFLSSLLSGTRTIIIMSVMGILLYIIRRFKIGFLTILLTMLLMFFTFALSQYSSKFRYTGAQNLDAKELFYNITELQGLENYYDQCRSYNYYFDKYSDFWFFENEVIAGLFSFIYKPTEMIIFWIPRSMWANKPLDPTFVEFTRYSLYLFHGFAPEYSKEISSYDPGFGTNSTAGILGRDLMRFGFLGPISTLLWFGLLLALSNIYYKVSYKRFECVLISLAFTGTCFAMFRDLAPGWTIQLSSLAIMTHFALRFSK